MYRLNTIATKWLSTAIAALFLTALAFAHGGFEHVMGTIAKVDQGMITVKTDKGDVDVKFDAKTVITKGDHKAAVEDLVVGLRVVAEVPEKDKSAAAESIKIGAAEADHSEHEDHSAHK